MNHVHGLVDYEYILTESTLILGLPHPLAE